METIENALMPFEGYRRSVYELKIKKRLYFSSAVEAEEYRELMPGLDKMRTYTYNALLMRVSEPNCGGGKVSVGLRRNCIAEAPISPRGCQCGSRFCSADHSEPGVKQRKRRTFEATGVFLRFSLKNAKQGLTNIRNRRIINNAGSRRDGRVVEGAGLENQ